MEESPIKAETEAAQPINDPHRVEEIVKELVSNQKRIRLYLLSHGVSENIVDEIAQETFIKAQKAAPYFKGESEVLTWQTRIALNTYVDMARKNKTKSKVFQEMNDEELRILMEKNPDESQEAASSADQLRSKEELSRINRAIEKLTPKHQQIIRAREDGQKYDEIAENLNIPIGTVARRLQLARQKLSEILKHESLS